jgi:hypothetical protein
MTADAEHFEIPRLAAVARHSVPRIVECTLIPLGLFYGFLYLVGVWGAILAALAWSYAAVIRRLIAGERIPGLLYLATIGATARTVLALVSGSVFVYFLQPSLVTAAVGAAFLLSVPIGQPLAQKLAHDFVPIPHAFMRRPAIRQVFVRITVVWAVVNLVNAGGAIALLLTQPVGVYVAAKTVLSWVMTGAGIAVSAWWFKRTTRRQGILVDNRVLTPAVVTS